MIIYTTFIYVKYHKWAWQHVIIGPFYLFITFIYIHFIILKFYIEIDYVFITFIYVYIIYMYDIHFIVISKLKKTYLYLNYI